MNALLKKAIDYATFVHRNQKRKSGEDYISHPIQVMEILKDLKLPDYILCGAILHDCIEDNEDEINIEEDIEKEFGQDIYFIVQALSKDQKITDKDKKKELYLNQFEKVIQVEPGVLLIKLADLIHNTSTLSHMSEESRHKWLDSVKYFYLPLFQRNFDLYCEDQKTCILKLINKLNSEIVKFSS